MQAHHKQLEREFVEIMSWLSAVLSSTEAEEVQEFVRAGEYGVALETLGAILEEEQKSFGPGAFALIVALARRMGIESSVVTDRLRQLVEAGS